MWCCLFKLCRCCFCWLKDVHLCAALTINLYRHQNMNPLRDEYQFGNQRPFDQCAHLKLTDTWKIRLMSRSFEQLTRKHVFCALVKEKNTEPSNRKLEQNGTGQGRISPNKSHKQKSIINLTKPNDEMYKCKTTKRNSTKEGRVLASTDNGAMCKNESREIITRFNG